ncbi:MAG: rhodanese-like domain-containing protein [Bacteroidales bacterium]
MTIKQIKTFRSGRIMIMVGLFILSSGAYTQIVTRITAAEFYTFLKNKDRDKLTIIDGRDSSMFNSGHINGAINLDALSKNTKTKLTDFTDEEHLIVYCTNHNRSKTLIHLLSESAYKGEIIFITDGINGWKSNGYEIVGNTSAVNTESQSRQQDSNLFADKLSPIIQVFGTAAYDAESDRYGYSFGRAHLGFQYRFNNNWSAKIIIDQGRPSTLENISVTDTSGKVLHVEYTSKEGSYYTMWLKFASLTWQVNDKLYIEGGALLQNHYITQERFWGFRYVAQTFQDLYWKIPSTDLGFMARYQINDVFSVDAALTNGEGPRVYQDAFGNMKYAAGLDIRPGNNFHSRIYYHNRKAGADSLSTEQMFSFFTGYNLSDIFRIGGELNYMENLNNISGLKSYGFSIYSAYQIIKNTQLFLRYDRLLYDKNNTTNHADGNTFMGGVAYSPVDNVNLALNYQGWLPDDENNKQENAVLLSMEYKF